jgi:hypothetical protein
MTLRDALAAALARVYSDPDLWASLISRQADAILSDPTFRAALVEVVQTALVEVEEDKYGEQPPECLDDTCGHDVCPGPAGIGCGDAAAIVARMLEAEPRHTGPGLRGCPTCGRINSHDHATEDRHPFTCGICQWGRDGTWHGNDEYVLHMETMHGEDRP